MKRPLVACLLLCLVPLASWAAAERVAVRAGQAGASSAGEVARVPGACEEAVRELTGLTVLRAPENLSPGRCGADEECLRALARSAGTEHLVVVEVVPRRPGVLLDVDVAWVDAVQGNVARRSLKGIAPATLLKELRPVVAALVPPFARKGWGGLVVTGETRLRVDGRMSGPESVLALPEGIHEVDLLPSSGGAFLTREEIVEGVRLHLEPRADPLPRTGTSRGPRPQAVRVASALTFSVGALAVAGSLVAGGLSRNALGGLRPCVDGPRDCTSFPSASLAYAQSGRYARTGNVLLGAGAGLVGVGVGLFVFDLFSHPSE